MFCMNCGQQLPDGAKYCLQCGTPQGAVSPTGTTQAETINLDGMHTFVPALCPNCNAHMKVDTSSKIALCDACGTECLVQDAIKALTVKGNVQVGNATINVNGTNTDSLLQRVEIMLGDGNFRGARSKCDTILDSDPTNGKAYFYMLMSDLNCRNRNELSAQKAPFVDNQFYIKAIRYGNPELKNELQGYINAINARNEAIARENEARAREARARNEAIRKNPKVGDEFHFGTRNGKVIWWKVLIVSAGKALVISRDDICIKKYHKDLGKITWADCTLRKWLNNEFISEYFTPSEQTQILPCKLKKDKNPNFKTRCGVPTTDRVFLLSINEVNQLFANNQARAIGSCWWLRSPGDRPLNAAFVTIHGEVDTYGNRADFERYGVRPALWLNLNS